MTEIRVNKIEAARRQIDTGIRLLFRNEDPVSIHTLAAAGFRILRDIAKDNPKSHMETTVKGIIKPGMEGEFWKAMHRPANFFKHADFDPDDILDGVQEEINDGTLFLASLWYQDLGYTLTPEMGALVTWFTVLNPHLLNEDAPAKPLLQRADFEAFRGQTRREQLEMGQYLVDLARQREHGT